MARGDVSRYTANAEQLSAVEFITHIVPSNVVAAFAGGDVLQVVLTGLAHGLPVLAVAFTIMPLGTAFLFPCVTGLLSRVISPGERGLYMGVQHTFGGVSRVIFPIAAGIGMVHQHFMLIPVMTVAENVVLASEPRRGVLLRRLESLETLARVQRVFLSRLERVEADEQPRRFENRGLAHLARVVDRMLRGLDDGGMVHRFLA